MFNQNPGNMEQFVFIPVSDYNSLAEQLANIQADLAELKQKAEAPATQDRLLTRSEAAEYLGRSLTCVNDWMKKGYLPFKRIGRKVYFLESDLRNAGKKGGQP